MLGCMLTRLFPLLWVLSFAVFSGGCQTAPVAAGSAQYSLRSLEANVDATLDESHAAVLDAVEALQFELTSERKDALNGQIVAQTALEETVTITVSKLTRSSSNITIRVGTLGDETKSRAIFDEIKKHL